MFSDTVTIFNRYESRLGDTWYATVLDNVHVNLDKAAIIAKYGAESQDNAVLNINYKNVDGEKMVCGKKWLPPKQWDGQINAMLSQTITFTGGQAFDFFMVGAWDGPGVILDDDYAEGFYDYMNRKYDYVFAITSVGGPYSVIPSFQIMGK